MRRPPAAVFALPGYKMIRFKTRPSPKVGALRDKSRSKTRVRLPGGGALFDKVCHFKTSPLRRRRGCAWHSIGDSKTRHPPDASHALHRALRDAVKASQKEPRLVHSICPRALCASTINLFFDALSLRISMERNFRQDISTCSSRSKCRWRTCSRETSKASGFSVRGPSGLAAIALKTASRIRSTTNS
jgi:hypothetical protein